MSALVVIVDDDVDLLFFLTRHLERAGAKARTFATAAQARAFLDVQSEPVAAICLDLSLPDACGFDLCAAFRADARLSDVPVVLMSGRAGLDEEARAVEVGASAFLMKPFRTKQFLDRLKPLLERRSAMPEVNS